MSQLFYRKLIDREINNPFLLHNILTWHSNILREYPDFDMIIFKLIENYHSTITDIDGDPILNIYSSVEYFIENEHTSGMVHHVTELSKIVMDVMFRFFSERKIGTKRVLEILYYHKWINGQQTKDNWWHLTASKNINKVKKAACMGFVPAIVKMRFCYTKRSKIRKFWNFIYYHMDDRNDYNGELPLYIVIKQRDVFPEEWRDV